MHQDFQLSEKNFWAKIKKDCPKTFDIFSTYIDYYKTRCMWNGILGTGLKLHNMPDSIQFGVFVQYILDCQGADWIDIHFTKKNGICKCIEDYFYTNEKEINENLQIKSTKMENQVLLTFGQAIEALKTGKKVARIGWNGKNMFVYLNKGSIDHRSFKDANGNLHPEENLGTIDGLKMNSLLFDMGAEGTVCRLPNLNMKSASNNIVTGWLASQTDMLAEDWIIVQ